MGAESKLKAKSAGDNESTPPAGYHSGRNNQCRLGSVAGDARGKTPLPTTPLSKTPPVFHTVWKRLWTFPRLFHSLWKTMLKSTVCIAVCNPRRPRIRALQQKNTPPRCPVDMHKKTGRTNSPSQPQAPPDVHKCRWTETPAFPQKTEKIRPQRPVCRGRNAAGHQKIPPKPPPGRGFPQSVKAKSGYSAQNRAGKNAKKFLPWLDIPVFHSSPPPTAPASGWKDRRMDGSRAGAREAESGQTLTERAGRHFPLSHYIY